MDNARHNPARYESLARVLKALAHPARLRILEAIEKNERCVCELTDMLGLDQSTVSKHLAALRQAGLVQSRKDGVMTFYSLKICCLGTLLDCIEGVVADHLRQQQEALRR